MRSLQLLPFSPPTSPSLGLLGCFSTLVLVERLCSRASHLEKVSCKREVRDLLSSLALLFFLRFSSFFGLITQTLLLPASSDNFRKIASPKRDNTSCHFFPNLAACGVFGCIYFPLISPC